MYYKPRFANGQLVPLSWPLALYRRVNYMCWPLEDNVNRATLLLDYFYTFSGFMFFAMFVDAESRYIRIHFSNIDEWKSAVPPFAMLLESILRTIHYTINKTAFKRLLQKFYAKIYISKVKNPELNKMIVQQLRYTKGISLMYILVVVGFVSVLIRNNIYNNREFITPLIPAIDVTPIYVYIPFTMLGVWLGVIIDTMIFGETTLVAEVMMHLNARYILLQQDLLIEDEDIVNNCDPMIVAKKYKEFLARTLQENVDLNCFAAEVEKQFSFRLFVTFAFSASLLCVLSYMAYTDPSDVTFIFWFIAKTVDLLYIGNLGSILEKTTNNISNMYYECSWEQVIYKSRNTRENVKLMKIIAVSIEVNSKPIYLTGLKYFPITLQTVLKILQGAYSYFTFLTSMGND